MFTIDTEQTIHITRGDIGVFEIRTNNHSGEPYVFKTGDVVRFKVFVKNRHDSIILCKDVIVPEENDVVSICLDKSDTKIGSIINKPIDYWYEVELNPDIAPQTIIGYDINGAKIFRLYPEGGDTE
jgi:hypothetical protein